MNIELKYVRKHRGTILETLELTTTNRFSSLSEDLQDYINKILKGITEYESKANKIVITITDNEDRNHQIKFY